MRNGVVFRQPLSCIFTSQTRFLVRERPLESGRLGPLDSYRGFVSGRHWGTVPQTPVCGDQKFLKLKL